MKGGKKMAKVKRKISRAPSHREGTSLLVNRVLLGIIMLIPGLLKLFVMGPDAIGAMLTDLGFGSSGLVFAWILIFSEIVFGVAILANWKIRYTKIPPIIILLVAAFTFYLYGPGSIGGQANWPSILVHLGLASNYWLLGMRSR